MIPVRDAVPAPTRPTVTIALVAITTASSLLWSTAQGGQFNSSSTAGTGGVGQDSASFAWLWASLSLVRASGLFQAITCAIALWLFGPTVEDRLGHSRFVLLYIGCAAAAAAVAASFGIASVTSVVLLPGAVAGVIGAHTALYRRARTLVLIPAAHGLDIGDVPAAMMAALWVVAQLAGSLAHSAILTGWSPSLALVQVAAGIVAGAAAGHFLKRPERMRVEWWSP
jgi:membrane associated rhomboid family serine protease